MFHIDPDSGTSWLKQKLTGKRAEVMARGLLCEAHSIRSRKPVINPESYYQIALRNASSFIAKMAEKRRRIPMEGKRKA